MSLIGPATRLDQVERELFRLQMDVLFFLSKQPHRRSEGIAFAQAALNRLAGVREDQNSAFAALKVVLLGHLGALLRSDGELSGGLTALRRAHAIIRETPIFITAHRFIVEELINVTRDLGEPGALELCHELEALYPRLSYGEQQVVVMRLLARLYCEYGDLESTQRIVDQAARVSAAIGDHGGVVRLDMIEAALAIQAGDETRMMSCLQRRILKALIAKGYTPDQLSSEHVLVPILLREECYTGALALLRCRGAAIRKAGNKEAINTNLSEQLVAARWSCRRELEAEVLDDAIGFYRQMRDDENLATALRQRALLAKGMGDRERALRLFLNEEAVRQRIADRIRDGMEEILARVSLANCHEHQAEVSGASPRRRKYWQQPLSTWGGLGLTLDATGNTKADEMQTEAAALVKADPASALAILKRAEPLLSDNTNALLHNLDLQLRIQEAAYDLPAALETQRRQTTLVRERGGAPSFTLDVCLNNEGMLLEEMMQYDEALATFREVETLCREQGLGDHLHRSIANQGRVLLEMRRYVSSLAMWESLQQRSRTANDTEGEEYAQGEIEKVYNALGKGTYLEILLMWRGGLAIPDELHPAPAEECSDTQPQQPQSMPITMDDARSTPVWIRMLVFALIIGLITLGLWLFGS
jgi:tetratricopeptide (TPR) repeat protein